MKNLVRVLAGAGLGAFLALGVSAQTQDSGASSGPSPEIRALIEDLEEETHQALWCAGAFGLLGMISEDPEESAVLTDLARTLVANARDQLAGQQVAGADFIALVAGYNTLVREEFEARDETPLRYAPDECFAAAGMPLETGSDVEGEAAPAEDSGEGDAAD